MVESLTKEEIFHYEPKVSKTKNEIDTFSIHSRLIKLLNTTRVTTKKGEQKEYTHTTIPSKDENGKITGGGKYNFSNSEYNNELKNILSLCIDHNYYPSMLSLTQKIGPSSCIHIDLDFRYHIEVSTRQYSKNDLNKLINIINNCINYLYEVPKEDINAYVFERKSGVVQQREKNISKDGIHIMYPNVVTNTKTQYILRENIINQCIKEEIFSKNFKSINSPDDIVDKAVIENSNWMLYGSRKTDRDPYEITHFYSMTQNNKILDTRTLLDKFDFSIINKSMEKEPKSIFKTLIEENEQKNTSKKKPSVELKKLVPTDTKRKYQEPKLNDLTEVRMLVKILSQERANNHDSWVRVGWCLYNIDKNNLLDDWIEFSEKSPKSKIKSIDHGRSPERCMVMWNDMKKQESGLGLGSLYRWAKEDDPKKYEDIRRSNLSNLITKSMSCTTYDVASVIYEMYKYNFKCISYKENKWYEFQPSKHRWIVVEKAHSLIKLISEDVVKQYLKTIYELNKQATIRLNQQQPIEMYVSRSNTPSIASPSVSPIPFSNESKKNQVSNSNTTDELLKMVEDLVNVTYKLRDISFKEKIVKECGTMFGENAKQFLESIDANPYLIGFDNGVYDLQADEFRDGRSEDFITFSTGYDYIDYGDIEGDNLEEEIKEIYEFFDQVFPQKSVREYILLLLSSFLGGTTRDEKFHIWTGIGGNGKSKLLELIEFALGDYSCKMSHTVLTRKQGNSSNASPDIEQTKGKRLASIQETEQDDIINVGRMKELSGGDKIYARGLFKDPIQFKPQFKMILLCNELPKINADDNGTWRRIRVVKFISKFVDNPKEEHEYTIDPLLSEKIYRWKEGFMYILLQKYKKYKKCGLKEPEEVLEETRGYQIESDIYSDFISSSIAEDPSGHIGLNETYRLFKEWFRNSGLQTMRPPSRTYFKGKMEQKLKQKYEHNKWTGFKLIEEDAEEDEEL
jgi:P4 family phage/plasmid primase-like protien